MIFHFRLSYTVFPIARLDSVFKQDLSDDVSHAILVKVPDKLRPLWSLTSQIGFVIVGLKWAYQNTWSSNLLMIYLEICLNYSLPHVLVQLLRLTLFYFGQYTVSGVLDEKLLFFVVSILFVTTWCHIKLSLRGRRRDSKLLQMLSLTAAYTCQKMAGRGVVTKRPRIT